MGFFKKLVDILFGTQKEYAVKDLGIFHSKVCDWWQNTIGGAQSSCHYIRRKL